MEECGEEREIDELHEVWRHEAGRWIVTWSILEIFFGIFGGQQRFNFTLPQR